MEPQHGKGYASNYTLVVTVAENQEECTRITKSSAIKLLGKASTATVNNIKRGLTTIQTNQISMSENKVEIDALGTVSGTQY